MHTPHAAVSYCSATYRRIRMTEDTEKNQILIVEDDLRLASMVAEFLSRNGFRVSTESRGDVAVSRITEENPEAVVLDINLPGTDGISVCRAVRARYDGVILVLTARGDEVDEVVSLEVGADDYMSKPVRPRALLARLQRHLRRSEESTDSGPNRRISVGSLTIDPSSRTVEIDSQPIRLTTAEFDLLYLLAENAGTPISRCDLYEKLHGAKFDSLDRSIDLRISRLRKKLGDNPTNPERVKSVRGVGYILAAGS